MRFLLQRIDIDVVAGNDLRYPSYNTALVLHGEAQIPTDGSGIIRNGAKHNWFTSIFIFARRLVWFCQTHYTHCLK